MSEETAIIEQENDRTFLDALTHPDPDPETLPALYSPAKIALQAETAAHLLRAAQRAELDAAALEQRRDIDAAAWNALIIKRRDRVAQWRAMVLAWMQRNDVNQVKTPWFTAFIRKAGSKIVVDDEARAIQMLHGLKGGEKAIRVKESLVKAEFDAIFNAIPKTFDGMAHEQTGEPSLSIRKG